VPALALALKASSAVWKKVQRTLKSVADALVESRMQRALIEINRYHRARGIAAAITSSPKPITALLARPTKGVAGSDDHTLS
jgi:hypothetical protein